MLLINTSTLHLVSFLDGRTAPPYAILSHTWGNTEDEVSFEEMNQGVRSPVIKKKFGYKKITMTCQLAHEKYKLDYAWVDTCCIDKSSSAELSEAINSMFNWYQKAAICFAFLADWDPEVRTFDHCRWFTRGWTLQELVAPKMLTFYDKTWKERGSKSSYSADIARVTKISEEVLTGQRELADVPVAVRLSWASKRETTREEDIAYSLWGIFDINMPLLYGEGHKAFHRLQEEIIKTYADLSIFAWKAERETCQEYMGILAPSPREFEHASRMCSVTVSPTLLGYYTTFTISNTGVQFHNIKDILHVGGDTGCEILPLFHSELPPDGLEGNSHVRRWDSCALYLRRVDELQYVRWRPYSFADYTINHSKRENTESFRAFKSLSAKDYDALTTRQLCFRAPKDLYYPPFGLSKIYPKDVWIPFLRGFFVHDTYMYRYNVAGYFTIRLAFEPEWSKDSFLVICRFRNPRGAPFSPCFWQCALLKNDKWIKDGSLPRDGRLSFDDNSILRVTKTLDLKDSIAGSGTKQVVLTVKREPTEYGHMRYYMYLRIKDQRGSQDVEEYF